MNTNHLVALAIAAFLACGSAGAQDASQDEVDPRALRKFWIGTQTKARALTPPPYTLTEKERAKYPGVFGVDLSHYSFDISTSGSCSTPIGYPDPKCSCSVDWTKFSSNGVFYIYSKASDGSGMDLSFQRFWSEMAPKHASKSMFRGAYHFLRPGVDAKAQAETFLASIGAVDGKKPEQLPPVLDIEWSSKRVIPDTSPFKACPVSRRTRNSNGDYYCDMWYTKSADEIVVLAKEWIDLVSKATGRSVVIYTNPTAWWNPVIGNAGNLLSHSQAIWMSRYTGGGPTYNPKWTKEGGSPEWKMPPLPDGASYPVGKYTTAHFWQFLDNGLLPTKAFTCNGKLAGRSIDMNWVPVNTTDYQALFGVSN
jgi:GH25 family lysozyme M1 (1,4-beta-N-acetylmuramidase)